MLNSNLLLWQRHWNYCSLSPLLPIFFRRKIDFFKQHSRHQWKCLSGSDPRISEMLLFGISSFNDRKNTSILNTTIDYILSTKRFDVPLTNFWFDLQQLCIENMSFKFYNLIVNAFTKFLPYYIIGLGIKNLLYLVN